MSLLLLESSGGLSIQVAISEALKDSESIQILVGGVWKQVESAKILVGGVWKEIG